MREWGIHTSGNQEISEIFEFLTAGSDTDPVVKTYL